ncbi:unnamed protein product [Blepharisma stoltei]|uniref:TmcB/TmcC TPR repeats domain-containing protein n=1 Tax=Blepharisma stoltei TaxID=1481888 RepID=A0AAU9IQG9_9CILI|nr:unnamed protein product [Blepharisma stoltei]
MSAMWGKANLDAHEILSKQVRLEQFRNFFYNLFENLINQKYKPKNLLKSQVAYEIATNTILTLQLIKLTWYPNANISEWEGYENIWKFLGYASYDSICAELGLIDYCLNGTLTLIATEFAILLILGCLYHKNKKPQYFLTFLPKALLFIFVTIGIIPSSKLIMIGLKYYVNKSNYIEEYGIRIQDNKFSSPTVIISIFLIFIFIIILIFSELFLCDMKHSHLKKNIRSRSSSKLDLQVKLFYIILCILYISFGNENIIQYQSLVFILSLYLALKSIKVVQYYNSIENWIQSCKLMMFSTTLLIFILGETLDNSEIILVFNIFLQPFVIYSTIWIVIYRHKKLNVNCEIPKNQFDFERKFRHLLIDKFNENKIEILDLFKIYWKMKRFEKNKIFVIWEFNFCYSIIKNERLARIKLSKISKAKYSLEGDIQEWKIYNKLSGKKHRKLSDINFLEFLQEFKKIRYKDKNLCNIVIKLYNEFISKKPSIANLINLVNKTSNNMNKINEGYKKLIEIHKNIEAYEYYSSFLENIIGNTEEAGLINKKKDGLNFYIKRNEYEALENYGKNIGVMLISCTEYAFGIISYINETAAQILKTSIVNAKGSPLNNFIPSPFDIIHEKSMKFFLQECTIAEIPSHKSLFFKASNDFLVECNIMIRLTAFHNNIYFLVSFKPIPSNRQIALLSQENIILNHSELFCYSVKSTVKDAKNMPATNIISCFSIWNNPSDNPFFFNIFDGEIALVYMKTIIKSTCFNILFALFDQEEILKWKSAENESQSEFSQNKEVNDFLCRNLLPDSSKPVQYFPRNLAQNASFYSENNAKCMQFENKRIGLQIESSSKHSSSRNSNSKDSNYAKWLLLKTKQKISILQWVLFFMMISVIVTMIAILAYIVIDVSRTSRMSSLGHLGNLLYYFEAATDSIRTLDKAAKSNLYTEAQMDSFALGFSSILDELDIIKDDILDDFKLWSYCEASKIIQEPIIPLWNFDSGRPVIGYDNLYDIISMFIITGKQVLNCLSLKQDFTSHTKFLYLNGLSYPFEYTNMTTNKIVSCEQDRVKVTGIFIYTLIVVGLLILGFLAAIVFLFIISVSKSHDEFWRFMLNNARLAMIKLKNSSIDRLMLFYGEDCNNESNVEVLKNIHSTHDAKSSLHWYYAWRILIFFIIAASYYFLTYFYIYKDCEEMMINRPLLLNNFNLRRALISRLSIFSRETMSPYMISLFKTSYAFPNPQKMVDNTFEQFRAESKELRKNHFSNLMSKELKDRIYEVAESDSNALNQGSYPLANDIIDEIYNLVYKPVLTAIEHDRYSEKITAVQDEILQEFLLADHDSKSIINGQLSIIINTTIVYSVAIIVLFFSYYSPFFIAQLRQIDRFLMLHNILKLEAE